MMMISVFFVLVQIFIFALYQNNILYTFYFVSILCCQLNIVCVPHSLTPTKKPWVLNINIFISIPLISCYINVMSKWFIRQQYRIGRYWFFFLVLFNFSMSILTFVWTIFSLHIFFQFHLLYFFLFVFLLFFWIEFYVNDMFFVLFCLTRFISSMTLKILLFFSLLLLLV